MALEEIAMEGPEAHVSDNVARLIATCSRGWERFFADHDDHQAPRFVPSVPERVFAVLAEVTTRHLPPNRVFCEWGSGFGTATCMASLLGYEAYGLEIDEELVRLSRAIARRLGIPVAMICTSLFPEGYEAYAGVNGAALVTPASVSDHHDHDEDRGPLRYDGMEIAIADIGVFFAYPWPEEQALMQQLFDAVAREGAMLVVYHTDTAIRVFRKVGRTHPPPEETRSTDLHHLPFKKARTDGLSIFDYVTTRRVRSKKSQRAAEEYTSLTKEVIAHATRRAQHTHHVPLPAPAKRGGKGA